jgi:hypothetical protein
MGTWYTSREPQRTALYDTVTGWAFGPTFENPEQADDYVRFCEARPDVDDVRALSPGRLEDLHRDWLRARGQAVVT